MVALLNAISFLEQSTANADIGYSWVYAVRSSHNHDIGAESSEHTVCLVGLLSSCNGVLGVMAVQDELHGMNIGEERIHALFGER